MLPAFINAIKHQCPINPSLPLVVGVSGGPDSLCLLDLLHQLDYRLVVAHLNHGLRPEADDEARLVEQISAHLDLPFVLEVGDVSRYAKENSMSIEESARILRYQFLFSLAQQRDAQAVVVGHTADDQVETVLMHLIRGAGIAGLKGMSFITLPNAWSQEIPLIRPLLAFWRNDILNYCRERSLNPVHDRSNLDTTYFRNRLRGELIPYMETYNPNIKRLILNMAESLAGDYQLIEQITEHAWQACIRATGNGYISIDRLAFLSQPLPVQRNMVRRAITTLRPGIRDLDFRTVTRAIEVIVTPTSTGRCDLLAGLCILFEGELVWLTAWDADLPKGDWPQLPGNAPISLVIPGRVAFASGWEITVEIMSSPVYLDSTVMHNTDPYQAWLDPGGMTFPLMLRPRQAGDRFSPLGMGDGSIKLADFMVNRKLPRSLRAMWPLVCSGSEIIWVPGLQICHKYRLTQVTQQVIHLRIAKTGS